MTYEEQKERVRQLLARREINRTPSDAQRADFAYGNAKIGNPDVTREMADRAVAEKTIRGLLDTTCEKP